MGLAVLPYFMARHRPCLLIRAFCIQVFLAVDSRSHSVSDTLYGIFPYIVPSFLVLLWIASKTSEEAQR